MKTLPLHSLPPDRMSAMTSQAVREVRSTRVEQARGNWQGYDPTVSDGCGAMTVVAVIVVAVAIYGGLFLLWI